MCFALLSAVLCFALRCPDICLAVLFLLCFAPLCPAMLFRALRRFDILCCLLGPVLLSALFVAPPGPAVRRFVLFCMLGVLVSAHQEDHPWQPEELERPRLRKQRSQVSVSRGTAL